MIAQDTHIHSLSAISQEFVAIAGSEALRNNESDSEKRKYPGGAFDPLGFTKDSKVDPLIIY